MRYENDPSEIRDRQESLKDAQDEIAIAAIEKQIKLIEDEIDALERQKEALSKQQEEIQKMMEASSKYYEKLIEEQEKYWDSIIEALENTKSKWEELAEIDTIARAIGLIEDEFGEFGYTVEDVLNDVPGAFDAFKERYIQLLEQMHSKDEGYLNGLKDTVGKVPEQYQKVATAATEAQPPITELGNSSQTASGKVSSLGGAASTAAGQVKQLKDNSTGIADNIDEINNVTLQSAIDGPLKEFEDKLVALRDLINGSQNSLKSAFEELNSTINLQTVCGAFEQLGTAIRGVTAELGGGGADSEQTYGAAGKNGKNGMPSTGVPTSAVSGATGEGLVGAINSVQESANTAIGTSAVEQGETAIGSFVALKDAVDNVKKAIGLGEEGGNAATEDGTEEDNLTAAITSILTTTDNTLNGSEAGDGVIKMFEEFKNMIDDVLKVAKELLEVLQEMSKIELPSFEGFTYNSSGGHYSLFSFGERSKFAGTAITGQHYEGTAKLNGDWGVKQGGTSLVGELGQELVVDSKSGKFRTVGDNGPEFVKLNPGDIVFNHLQTRELLSKGNLVVPKKGKAFAQGTIPEGFMPFDFSESYASLMGKIKEIDMPTMSGIKTVIGEMTRNIRMELQGIPKSDNFTTNVNQNNTFNVSGVTGEEVAQKINSTLMQTFSGMSLNAYQRSMA